jgi:serine/threonine protein kinase
MKRSSHSKTQSVSSLSSDEEMAVARLNDTYDLIKVIGKGSTCKVWLARHVDQPSFQFAIKIMSSNYMKMNNAMNNISKEVQILRKMQHEGIVKIFEYGDDGVVSYDNQLINNRVYIVMEYVEGPLLFDLCKK